MDVVRTVGEAIELGCAAVCVHPAWVRLAVRQVGSSGVAVCSVAGFPMGVNKPTLKAIEATAAIKDGASEIDVVAFLPNLLARDVDAARAELMEIVRGARATRRDVVVKVIVETALLMQNEDPQGAVADACRAVRESGADYIKTSTGMHAAGGATLEAVRLLKKHAEGLLVKAAGGIRDRVTAEAMVAAGADRLGCSGTVGVLLGDEGVDGDS